MTEKELKVFDDYDYPFLNEPVPVTKQNWPDDVPPLVSVSCKTYMHENFIRDAIEGFIMQKTTFRVEVIIHDDASTDKTADIVREYEAKHPQLIKTTYQVENQYKKNPKTSKFVKPHPRQGKYVALCEGDDYWTDPMKLQKQVEFMEANPDYVMCYHSHRQRTGNIISPTLIPAKGMDFTGDELITTPPGIATASKLFRNVLQTHSNTKATLKGGDYRLNAYLGTFGHCKFIPEVAPTIRRLHSGGVFSSKTPNKKAYSNINVKIAVYNFFKEQDDVRRAKFCYAALKKTVDNQLLKLMFSKGKHSYRLTKNSLPFYAFRVWFLIKPGLLRFKKKITQK